MKKIIALIILLISVCSLSAQTYKYYTNSFAYKYYENNRWTDWSDWERSHVLVVISIDRNIINIYSETMQEYDIYEYTGEEKDGKGGSSFLFQCVNKDGLRCQIRLRIQSDGSKQLYVDFNDCMWVYGIEER
jgi:hypothetical protein